MPWMKPVRDRLEAEFGKRPPICVMATADANGSPTARSMTLRDIDESGSFLFVSDRRSRKDNQLRSRPACELVFWLSKTLVQIRVRGQGAVVGAEMDDYHRSTWWAKLDKHWAYWISGNDAGREHQMPSTFELLVIHPEEVEMDEYAGKRGARQWKKVGRVWQPQHSEA